MSKVKNENFIVIHGWMINELELKGNELLTYAFIYGITQDIDNQYFTGSQEYISNWLNCTRRSVINTLKSLEEKELIEKEEVITKKGRFLQYKVGKKFTTPVKKVHNPCEKSSHNNIEYNIVNNKTKVLDEDIKIFWNSLAKENNLPTIQAITPSRKKHLLSRVKEVKDFEEFKKLIEFNISNSSFLKGDNNRNWKVDFDWMLNPTNFIKIIEGKYTDSKNNSLQSTNDDLDYEFLARVDNITIEEAKQKYKGK